MRCSNAISDRDKLANALRSSATEAAANADSGAAAQYMALESDSAAEDDRLTGASDMEVCARVRSAGISVPPCPNHSSAANSAVWPASSRAVEHAGVRVQRRQPR